MHTGEILFLAVVVGAFIIFSVTLAVQVAAYERAKATHKPSEKAAAAAHHAHA